MTDIIINTIVGFISALGTGSLTWIFTRKKNKADLTRSEIENIDFAADTWQKTVNRLEKHIENQTITLDSLREENLGLKDAIYKLQDEVTELKNQNKRLIGKLNKLEKYEKKLSDNIDNNSSID